MKRLIKPFAFSYLFTWFFVICFYLFNVFSRQTGFTKIIESLFSFLTSKRGLLFIHILFLIFFLLLIILKYFVKVYREKGLKKTLLQVILRLIIPVFIFVYGFTFLIDYNNYEDFAYEWNTEIENTSGVSKQHFLQDEKLRGMNVYNLGRLRRSPENTMKSLIKSNIEWVAVLPYFYQETENSKEIRIPDSVGIWSRRDSTFIKNINKLHDKKLFVMLKPHLWMNSGWRSNIKFEIESDWDIWFDHYRKISIHYALLAQKTNVDLFCIGTELQSSLKAKPKKWLTLIKEIKSIYKGKITYAANWDDDFEFKAFWKHMDYIGVQAYYPLTKNVNPTLEEIKEGWNSPIKKLKTISTEFDKKIIFTEIGYRSDASATIKPWEWGSFSERLHTKKSDKTQLLAYQALFEKTWNKPWLAGIFPWEWNSSDFPIYNRPSENMIAIWYSK